MKHIFSVWNGIKNGLKGKNIYLFLDCDGTLAPIADTPDKASIPDKTKEVLGRLSRLGGLRLAIISGRSLSDIRSVVGLDGIIYVGNHGLEVEGEDITSEWKIIPSYKENLARIKTILAAEYAATPGVFIEDKGLSLCLHYRMADTDEDTIRDIFRRITGPFKEAGKIATMDGKKVIEVRPATGWGKGKIVKWLLARERMRTGDNDIFPIYVGDDTTDEEAFKALGDNGIAVMVGNVPASSARYYADNTDEVYQLLTMILKFKEEQNA
ncbi:MAG: trehalose-phosphatase [Candidatus Omnitrophica bacterium]|nr:trehalose-phosphatase [Candidatus Omnitrophota bacterium]